MWFAAAIGSAVLFGLAGWWMKVSQMQGGSSAHLFLGLYLSGTAGFGAQGAVLHTLGSALADPRVWLAGLLIGSGSALGNALFMRALAVGPASLTSPLTNLNILLVIGLGTLVYGETLTAFELTGVILLLLAIVLIAVKNNGKAAPIQPGWHLYVGISILLFAVRNGGLKVTQELGLDGTPVLFAAYLLSLIGFAWVTAWNSSKVHTVGALREFDEASSADAMKRLSGASTIGLKWGLLAGVFSYGGLQLYALALGSGQASIAGPIFAANSLVVAAGAIVLYRERLNGLQWSAFVLLIAGLVLIRL